MSKTIWSRSLSYGLALASVLLATALRMLADSILRDRVPFITYYPAIVFVAYYAGIGPALFATGISGLAAAQWFIPPKGALAPDVPGGVSLLLFAGFAVAIAVYTDWTRRRLIQVHQETHQILRESEQRLNDFFDNAQVALHWVGPDGRILRANQAELDLLGYTREEYIGRHIAEFHADVSVIEGILDQLTRGESLAKVPARLRRKDGSIRDVLISSNVLFEGSQFIHTRCITIDVSQQLEMLEALQESEERFRELANQIDQFVWTCDELGSATWYNQRWYDYTGTNLEQMRGWGWKKVHHPDHVDRVVEKIQKAFDSGEAWEDTFPLKGKDGLYRWFLSRALPIRDRQGRVIRWFGTNTDVTKELKAEEALRESEDRFRTMTNVTPAILWTASAVGRITWASVRWFEDTGLSPKQQPLDWSQVLHPEDMQSFHAAWNKALAEGGHFEIECRHRRQTGEYHWCLTRATPIRDPDGQIVGWCGSTMDIHRQKQMEQSQRFLAEASKSLSSLVEYKSTLQLVAKQSVPVFADWCAIDMQDEEGVIERVAVAPMGPANVQHAYELLERHFRDGGGVRGVKNVIRTGKPEWEFQIRESRLLADVRDEEHRKTLENLNLSSYLCVPLRIKDKTWGAITFVHAESGRQYGRNDLVLAEDLAHRAAIAIENARLYHEVQESHQRKDEFLAMLAHELRNPLAPISSGLDILAMDESCDRETIRVMQDQVEHVVRLVDDLLDVSRIMQNKIELRKESIELSTIVHRSIDAARFLIDNKQHELLVSLPEEAIWLHADAVRIIQVLENLLNNSAKYTEEGGRIELRVEVKQGQAAIRVQDTGIGIEPELLPTVFELFTQSHRSLDRSQGGLGIGLTLVHRLVELHGGTVSAQSGGPGQGSTFVVRLPLSEAPAQTEAVVEQNHESQARRIVVVDDNVGAAMLLSKLLGMLGDHQVLMAHDGHSALELIQETRPEIVLLDIGLPGMNGYEVAQAVRENPEFDGILLVALTGYGQKEDRLKSREAGFDEHHVKPPSIDQMQDILKHPKLKKAINRAGNPAASTVSNAGMPRMAIPSRTFPTSNDHANTATMAALDLPQFKHDLGNVAYVLSLIGEMYCSAIANSGQMHEAKKAIEQEVGTIQNLVEKIQDVLDNGKFSH